MQIQHVAKQATASLVLALGFLGAAQAGLLTGSADPAFGSSLPGVSYRVDYSLFVDDAILQYAKSHNNTVEVNGGVNGFNNVFVTGQVSLYESEKRENFVSADFRLQLASVTFDLTHSGVVTGWGLYSPETPNNFANLSNLVTATGTTRGKNFGFTWSSLDMAPELFYSGRRCSDCPLNYAYADIAGLVVNYIDRFNDTDGFRGSSKIQDANGKDAGVQYSYDANKQRLNTQFGVPYVNNPLTNGALPEPASVALVLAALFGVACARRRI